MLVRPMNKIEKANAKLLKDNGFTIFWEFNGPNKGDYWAIHPKLIAQYHVATKCNRAIIDLRLVESNN